MVPKRPHRKRRTGLEACRSRRIAALSTARRRWQPPQARDPWPSPAPRPHNLPPRTRRRARPTVHTFASPSLGTISVAHSEPVAQNKCICRTGVLLLAKSFIYLSDQHMTADLVKTVGISHGGGLGCDKSDGGAGCCCALALVRQVTWAGAMDSARTSFRPHEELRTQQRLSAPVSHCGLDSHARSPDGDYTAYGCGRLTDAALFSAVRGATRLRDHAASSH